MPPSFAAPEKFRPENPEAFADVEPLQKSLLEDLRAGAEAMEFTPPAPAEASAPPLRPWWPPGRRRAGSTRPWRP